MENVFPVLAPPTSRLRGYDGWQEGLKGLARAIQGSEVCGRWGQLGDKIWVREKVRKRDINLSRQSRGCEIGRAHV